RVLEIGCGSGLLLFRVAPQVDSYHGTDLSEKGLDHLRRQLSASPDRYRNIVLSRQMAHDFSGLARAAYDTVILNSVVQYFPSVDYLVRVLEGAVAAVKPGGTIFLGDLRSLRLLDAFHASVQLHDARSSLTVGELRRRVQLTAGQEKELVIDPGLFTVLRSHLPAINRVEVQIKRGRYRNELSKFRYDVILHVGDEPCPRVDGPWLNWRTDVASIDALSEMLRDSPRQVLGLADVINARVAEDVQALEAIASADALGTVGELRQSLDDVGIRGAVEPEDLWALGSALGYEVELKWAAGSSQNIDLVLRRRGAPYVELAPLDRRRKELRSDEQSWTRYANNPLQGELARTLVPQLRRGLAETLPEHMMPSAFVVLDSLPLTANGKIDRQSLPAPGEARPELESDYIAPRSEAEESLASIWKEVLKLEQIGVHDDFFQLGGHSLLATQVISRVRERLQTELPLRHLFEFPTIEGLAAAMGEAQTRAAAAPSVITRSDDGAAADLLANLDQLTDEQVEALLHGALRDNVRN
ncbi:MAG: phosphopantetheine-binding protein, partial [Acidobacteriota bacterium]